MRKDGFTVCANKHVECLRREGRYATAHVYENALRSFTVSRTISPGIEPLTMIKALSHQSLIKKISYRFAYSSIL